MRRITDVLVLHSGLLSQNKPFYNHLSGDIIHSVSICWCHITGSVLKVHLHFKYTYPDTKYCYWHHIPLSAGIDWRCVGVAPKSGWFLAVFTKPAANMLLNILDTLSTHCYALFFLLSLCLSLLPLRVMC